MNWQRWVRHETRAKNEVLRGPVLLSSHYSEVAITRTWNPSACDSEIISPRMSP